jgi:hypothetical protein
MTFAPTDALAQPSGPGAALRRWAEAGRAKGLHPAIRRRDTLLWLVVIAFAVLQAPLVVLGPFAIGHVEAGQLALFMCLLFVASRLMLVRYSDPVLGLAFAGYAQMTSISLVGIGYSYFAASLAMPLQDELFMAMDRAMGLDWMAYMEWLTGDRRRLAIAGMGYASMPIQIVIVVPLLALFHRFHAMQVFILAWFIGAVVTFVVFAGLPAVSTFEHLGIVERMKQIMPVSGGFSHLPDFLAARAGGPITLYVKPQGMIAFPSFHACGGALLMWAFWQVKWLRWPGVAVNAVMIAATPVIGSHYFVDVIAGVALAVAAIALAKRLFPQPA